LSRGTICPQPAHWTVAPLPFPPLDLPRLLRLNGNPIILLNFDRQVIGTPSLYICSHAKTCHCFAANLLSVTFTNEKPIPSCCLHSVTSPPERFCAVMILQSWEVMWNRRAKNAVLLLASFKFGMSVELSEARHGLNR